MQGNEEEANEYYEVLAKEAAHLNYGKLAFYGEIMRSETERFTLDNTDESPRSFLEDITSFIRHFQI